METMKRSLSIVRDSLIYGNPQVSKYKPFFILFSKNLLQQKSTYLAFKVSAWTSSRYLKQA